MLRTLSVSDQGAGLRTHETLLFAPNRRSPAKPGGLKGGVSDVRRLGHLLLSLEVKCTDHTVHIRTVRVEKTFLHLYRVPVCVCVYTRVGVWVCVYLCAF